jgi:cell division protease FtsH
VAEEIVFGDISTGAQNDLQRVTDLARHMVTQYGMSDTLGLVTFEEPRTNPFLNVSGAGRSREYSEKTAQAIDDEIRTIVAEARERYKRRHRAARR